MIPEDFFFPVFSGGIFHRNVVLEGVTGIPVFGRRHRIFSQEFLSDSSGLLRIPVHAKRCQAQAS